MAPVASMNLAVTMRPSTRVAAGRAMRPIVLPKQAAPRTVLCKASDVDMDKQMREAEARWESQVREGKVRNVTCKGAGDLLKEGWVLLDVRPPIERKKAGVEGAVSVPLFVEDNSLDPGSLLKQMSAFGMGGWWLGTQHMKPNDQFMPQVLSKVPKDANVIVCCQKGLRSLAACEQMSRAGYQSLAWINGGLDTFRPGDMPSKDDVDLRRGALGGMSEVLGWTEVQQEELAAQGRSGTLANLGKIAVAILVLDLVVFAVEQIRYQQSLL